jgi:soluble lytic murein transglycosylase
MPGWQLLVKKFFPLVFALVMLAGGAWLVITGQWLNGSGTVFSGASAVSQTQAKALYRQSLASLQAKDYAQAAKGFKKLVDVYPGLHPIIALHQAEAYENLPDERSAQLALKAALDKNPPPMLAARLLYELASSDFRAKEYNQAKVRFTQLKQLASDNPQVKDLAIAADYFLGLMGVQQVEGLTREQGIAALSQYIRQSPTGRYASFAALALSKALPKPGIEQQTLIGTGLATNPEYAAEAVKRLTPLPRQSTWLPLAHALVQAAQPAQAVKTVIDGYKHAQTREQADTALALLTAHGKPLKPLLETLDKQNTRFGDLVLWELTDAGTSNNLALYRRIVQLYPKGDYAPESSWHLLWAKRHDATAFLDSATAHEQLFRVSRSYPRVLFWHAKMLEQLKHQNEATALYSQLAQQFTAHYYGYRAKARLAVLTQQGSDPAWQLNPNLKYPEHASGMATPDTLTQQPDFLSLQELVDIGAADDAHLLAEAAIPDTLKPDAKTWIDWHTGKTVRALKTLREHLEQTQLKGEAVSPDQLKMAYPLKYTETIARFTRETRVNPFLVTALMREESSFNPQAVSTSQAYGLMQLLVPTASEQVDPQDRPLQAQDLFNPLLNIKAGSRYVAWLFNYTPLGKDPRNVVAAYNAGPGQVSGWLDRIVTEPDAWVESLPAEETRDYIRRVFTSYWTYTLLYANG